MTNQAKRACPLLILAKKGNSICGEAACAWWCETECAIHALGYIDYTLQDIARKIGGVVDDVPTGTQRVPTHTDEARPTPPAPTTPTDAEVDHGR